MTIYLTLSFMQSRITTLIPKFFVLQMHVLSVSGPVVTAAGHGDLLAIVSHASDCLPSGDQVFISILTFVIADNSSIDICSESTYGFK